MVVTNMSSSSPAITNFAYWCSVSYPTVKVFEMLFWKPKLTRLGDTTLDLESMLPSSLTDANKKRDYRIFEVKTLLNRQNYPKKRLLSDKIAHSGISRDYYCKKFHFWKCNSTVFEKNSAWAPIRRQTFLTTSHNMHIFALAISVLVTTAGNVYQPEALPRKSESNIILITWTIIRIMILLKEGPE